MTDSIIRHAQEFLQHVPLLVVSQGAEALVFETNVHPYLTKTEKSCIIKYRPPKPYRHPKIDSALTKSRTIGEAKFMAKLSKLSIRCPTLILADINHGIIWMEYIGTKLPDGSVSSLKNWLWMLERSGSPCVSDEVHEVLVAVGQIIGQLHVNDMIHGDLTSSNIILVDNLAHAALIDFGLSSYSGIAEDKAVDLYVLERAVASTHSVYAEKYNKWLLEGYEKACKSIGKRGIAQLKDTMRKLEDVRLRGRKRSMLG